MQGWCASVMCVRCRTYGSKICCPWCGACGVVVYGAKLTAGAEGGWKATGLCGRQQIKPARNAPYRAGLPCNGGRPPGYRTVVADPLHDSLAQPRPQRLRHDLIRSNKAWRPRGQEAGSQQTLELPLPRAAATVRQWNAMLTWALFPHGSVKQRRSHLRHGMVMAWSPR